MCQMPHLRLKGVKIPKISKSERDKKYHTDKAIETSEIGERKNKEREKCKC